MITKEQLLEALKVVEDPDLHMDIVKLKFIRDLVFTGPEVRVVMTLSSPACPFAMSLMGQIEDIVMSGEGVEKCDLDVVWDPPWRLEEAISREEAELMDLSWEEMISYEVP